MNLVLIVMILAFSITLCIVEIPKMRKNKENRELAAFSIILALGTLLTILKCLSVEIPNPADFVQTVFSPFVSLIKGALE